MKSIEQAEAVIEHFEELQQMAAKVASQLIELETGRREHIDPEEINVECGALYANWETYCCGDTDYHSTHIPLKYLFDEDWQEEAKVEIERKRQEAAEKERIRKEKAELAAKERERQQYLKLKAKFEGGA